MVPKDTFEAFHFHVFGCLAALLQAAIFLLLTSKSFSYKISAVDNELITVPYTAKRQPTRQYTVKDNVIYNEDGKEVFSTPSIDRNKILANAAIKLKQAVVVDFKNAQYVDRKSTR